MTAHSKTAYNGIDDAKVQQFHQCEIRKGDTLIEIKRHNNL